MKLEEKLISLSEYGIGFRTYKNNFVISITFREGWSIIKPSDEMIKFMRDTEKHNTYYYATEVSSDLVHLEGIFNSIDETISYNKEIEEKTALLKEKIDELSKLFIDTPISDLKKLEFVIPQPKKTTTKRKKTTKSDKKTKTEEAKTKTEENKPEVQKIEEKIEESEIDKKIKLSMEKVNNKQRRNSI